jgi:hypothetical protein
MTIQGLFRQPVPHLHGRSGIEMMLPFSTVELLTITDVETQRPPHAEVWLNDILEKKMFIGYLCGCKA